MADYTLMLMLASLRNLKEILRRSDIGDYTQHGLRGRELSHMTVGVMGSGHIGTAVIHRLSGFACRVLAFDASHNEEATKHATYTDLPTLLRESDLLSIHVPAEKETTHLLDASAIALMKHGAILINTARGSIVDTAALIKALESGQITATGLDTLEGEKPIFSQDFKKNPLAYTAFPF